MAVLFDGAHSFWRDALCAVLCSSPETFLLIATVMKENVLSVQLYKYSYQTRKSVVKVITVLVSITVHWGVCNWVYNFCCPFQLVMVLAWQDGPKFYVTSYEFLVAVHLEYCKS
jgi:hypothetical protein